MIKLTVFIVPVTLILVSVIIKILLNYSVIKFSTELFSTISDMSLGLGIGFLIAILIKRKPTDKARS